jgi:hypothetical protein
MKGNIMAMKTLALALLCLSGNLYAEVLINDPNLPHPAAAVEAYQNHEKVQRNENAAKVGAANAATQVRPVNGPANGRINNIGRPGGIR